MNNVVPSLLLRLSYVSDAPFHLHVLTLPTYLSGVSSITSYGPRQRVIIDREVSWQLATSWKSWKNLISGLDVLLGDDSLHVMT